MARRAGTRQATTATSVARPLLDGLGNEDEFRTDHEGGFIGMSFRFFDPDTKTWAIYWADSRRPGALDPPVVGSFSGDTGTFEGTDTFEGRPILVRFVWSGDTVGQGYGINPDFGGAVRGNPSSEQTLHLSSIGR